MSEKENQQEDWEQQLARIIALGASIHARRGGQPLPPPDEIIRQMREERTAQLEQVLGPWRLQSGVEKD